MTSATFRSRVASLALYSLVVSLAGTTGAQAPNAPALGKALGSLRDVPEAQRGARTGELAHQIATLPAGKDKLSLAVGLAHLSTEGDPGRDNLQAVTDTLGQSLAETPAPGKPDAPSSPYVELAELVRYEGMKLPGAMAGNAQYAAAEASLVALEASIEKADFTLTDTHNKQWKKSDLRGKVVVINFWATWCPPCRQELPTLDALARYFAPQDVVVLALTDEPSTKILSMLRGNEMNFHILFDNGHHVADSFHVAGIPRTFVFNREGKLVAESIDMRTQRQFLQMLGRAGVHA